MTDVFALIQEEVSTILMRHNAAREIRVLNLGSDRSGEQHWRFRTPEGQIVTIKMEVETP